MVRERVIPLFVGWRGDAAVVGQAVGDAAVVGEAMRSSHRRRSRCCCGMSEATRRIATGLELAGLNPTAAGAEFRQITLNHGHTLFSNSY